MVASKKDTPQERDAQRSYWQEHSSEATVEAMMLDSQASEIDKQERPEVMTMLGSVDGKKILELGAGIGRFTGELARTAEAVEAVDFMENLIDENKSTHGHMKNVSFRVADATELNLELSSYDVVFSNWLLMYLGDEEVAELASRTLQWVREGGVVFFRESCFRQSGDKKRKNNPTHYRNPREYFQVFDKACQPLEDGRFAHFELVACKCVDTYVRVKHNQNQISWKWRKVVCSERPECFRHFLDNTQYSNNGILRYERIFGPGFVSTGGIKTTQEFVSMLQLQPNQSVLDIGCGIGGGDFFMARECDVFVHGIDLSVNMVLMAIERANLTLDSKVSFEIADCTTCTFLEASFDVVYSRDTILHIQDKPALFKRLLSWLKPGGKLLISDYCKSELEASAEFQSYIAQRGYDLHSVVSYGAMLEEAGFEDVLAEDRTWQLEKCLRSELEAFADNKEAFVRDFSEEDCNAIVTGWNDKLKRVDAGEQKWGLFRASKPKATA